MDLSTRVRDEGQVIADLWPNAITAEGRCIRPMKCHPHSTVSQVIARADLPTRDLVVTVNSQLVEPDAWDAFRLTDGDIVTLRVALRGGGGGGDSDPISAVIAVATAAAVIALPVLLPATALTIAGASITWGSVAAIGASLAGGLVLNALAPTRAIDLTTNPAFSAVEPIYTLTGGSNRSRVNQPHLLVLGTHRVFPDLASREYTEFNGNHHYLSQLFHFGLGDLDVSDLKIGPNALNGYSDVDKQWGQGSERVIDLIAGNVDSQAGGELADLNVVTRRTSAATTKIGLDFTGRIFRLDDQGNIVANEVDVEIGWERSDGVILRYENTFRHDSQELFRHTITIPVASGTYTVRVRRVSAPSSDERTYDDITLSAIRSYQRDQADYSGQHRLGVKIRATGQLAGRIDRLSAQVSQKVPVFNRTDNRWGRPQKSENPAAILRWYAQGIYINGRLAAGIGLADARIDHTNLAEWYTFCEREELTCSFVIDRAMSHNEVLTLICQCGRASPSWQSGRLGVIYDEANRPATTMISPGTIKAGSFRVDYTSERVAEEIAVRYIEPELDWQSHTIRCQIPGLVGYPTSSVTLSLPGVTSRDQAAAEASLQAARQAYHRRRFKWSMAAEGLALARGDVVFLTHGLIDGGVTGRFVGGDGSKPKLDRAVRLNENDEMVVRLPDGTLHSAQVTFPSGMAAGIYSDTVHLDPPIPDALDAQGASPVDHLWRLYAASQPPAKVKIVALEPEQNGAVRLEAIDEVYEYYQAARADLGVTLPERPPSGAQVIDLSLSETLVRVGSGLAVELNADLSVSGDWRGGIILMKEQNEEARIVARLSGADRSARWLVRPEGTLTVTAVPGTEAVPSGHPVSKTYTVIGRLAPPGAVDQFAVHVLGDGTRRFSWESPKDADFAGIVIRYAKPSGGDAPQWDAMTPLHEGVLSSSPYETIDPGIGRWTLSARAFDTGGRMGEERRIVAEFGPRRLGETLLWFCSSTDGWPGVIGRGERDFGDRLSGDSPYTWNDLTSWSNWISWALGEDEFADTNVVYTTEVTDLGAPFYFAIDWDAQIGGEAQLEVRSHDSNRDLSSEVWEPYAAGHQIRGRYAQLRWSVGEQWPKSAFLGNLCFLFKCNIAQRRFLDHHTSQWQGSASSGREIPHDLGFVTDIHVTLQSVGAGWSWSLVQKNDPTRIRIYDGNGRSADALVDVVVRGSESNKS